MVFTETNLEQISQSLDRLQVIALPPKTSSTGKVPIVRGIKVLKKQQYEDRVDLAVSFIEPRYSNSPVSFYNIYASGAILKNKLSSPFCVRNSPAEISVPITPKMTGTITLTFQTVLENGFATEEELCPTTSISVQSVPTSTATFIQSYAATATNGAVLARVNIPANTLNVGSLIKFTLFGKVAFTAGAAENAGLTVVVNGGAPSFTCGVTKNLATAGAEDSYFKYDFLVQITNTTSASIATIIEYSTPTEASYVRPPNGFASTLTLDITQSIILELQYFSAFGAVPLNVVNGYYEILNNISN